MKNKKPAKYTVFFDFDNTIVTCDVFDSLLPRFSVNNAWQALEKRWEAGEIGSEECLKGQMEGMRISRGALDKYLAGIKLDASFKNLLGLLNSKKIKVIVLSDNFDYILNRILKVNAVGKLKIYSNKLKFAQDRINLSFPFRDKQCRLCAHCKTKNLLASAGKNSIIIYIGDGRSDICPAKYADIVFAKESLLRHYYKDKKINCIPYNNLKDVYDYFKRSL